jgi:PepSY-associated transmembrane protein
MLWLRKWTILIHRWLGIVLSLLFVVWFISGIAMIYAGGMPSLTREERLERLPPLDLSKIKLNPSEALEKAELGRPPGAVTLLNVMDRPAYRFGGRDPVIVFADNGDLLGEVGEAEAITIAGRFMKLPVEKLHYAGLLTKPDQWTVGERGQLPMHKITVDDPDRTELYVSEASAEVGLITTRGTRALAWVAAIPHWLYFASLRSNGPLWSQVVIWSSAIGTVLALLGIVVGVVQFSRSRPHIPYAGWMRWHYITGAIFGVFTATWVFSGMLSMEPFPGPAGPGTGGGLRQALSGGPLNLPGFPPVDTASWNQVLPDRSIKEIDFLRIQGDPHYVVRGVEAKPLLLTAAPLQIRKEPFPIDSVMSRVRQNIPDVPIAESQLLASYDSYYYARGFERPLPVLRLKFADADSTWIYIDPAMSQAVARFTSRDRVERWLYHGLHSLDFPFWYYERPLWDIGVIVLSLGGIATSGIGLFIGMKRVIRHVRRFLRGLESRVQPKTESTGRTR